MANNSDFQYSNFERDGTIYIQVVLIPVGGISPSRFTEFSKKITEYSIIPLQNLTRPGGYSHERSPFKEFSWDNGALYFNFCDNPEEVRNSWEDYQVRLWSAVRMSCHEPESN
jgi:hypothetical protein